MYDQVKTAGGNIDGTSGLREPGSVELFRDSLRGLARLAMTETSLALTSIPRLIAVCLIRVLLLCLGVFGTCLGGALALYSYSGSILLALVAFLLPMAAIITVLGSYQGALRRELTLPATRAEIEAYTELFKEACNGKTTAESRTARPEHGLAGQT